MRRRGHFNAILLLSLLLLSCTSTTVQMRQTKVTPTTTVSLRTLAQARGISIGTAVDVQALASEAQYRSILSREFTMVTPENAMKFAAIRPAPNVYSFQDADSIVAFAKAHAMQVRGHTLVWYRVIPSWLTNGNFSRAELMGILRDHIMTVVSHYRSQVNIWDVVNEAIAGDGSLRNSFWLQHIGPDYLDWAFRWAHEANPQARLFYNDSGGEGSGRKSDAIYTLVKGLLKRGVPISGVGLQMHLSLTTYPTPHDVLANMNRLAALGLEVQITEMDVEIQGAHGTMAEKLSRQAQLYQEMLSICLAAPNCKAFVMWGFTDRHSWIPQSTGHPDAPLIFDEDYRPKQAYYGLIDVLNKASVRLTTLLPL